MLKQGPAECGSGVNSGESTLGILLNHFFFQTIFPIRTLQILKWSLFSRVPHIGSFSSFNGFRLKLCSSTHGHTKACT